MLQARTIVFHTDPELFYEFTDFLPKLSVGVNDLIAERIDLDILDPFVFHFVKSHAVRQREGTRDAAGRYTFPNALLCDDNLLDVDLANEDDWERREPDAHSMICERCVKAKQYPPEPSEGN